MHINDPDAPLAAAGRPHTADNTLYRITSRRSRRLSSRSSTTSSSAAALSDGDSFTIALDAFARPQSASGLRETSSHALRPRMGSTTTITAAAAAQAASGVNWPGGIMRETDIQVESRELAGLDAELRRRAKYLPREDSQWPPRQEYEALRDLANFLREVTPPPGNYMSIRTPSSPSSSPSVTSSLRRRKSLRKPSALKRCLGVLMRKGNGKMKKLSKRRSTSSLDSVARPPSVRKKRWPSRIRLPDTAVAGTTVEGHRHIAISIPIEHAHLGPEPRYKFPKRDRRRRSRSTADAAPRIYNDINVRPISALISETHVGTQLGPVAEERESLSSKTPSWEKASLASGSGGGGLHDPAEVRKVRLASRNTFGTVHEEFQFASGSGSNSANNSRPVTRSASSPNTTMPLTPPPRSSSGEYFRPQTPASSGRRSDETGRKSAHRMGALAALTSSTNSRPGSSSAHSLRSFASASPGGTTAKVYYPKRNSSLQPSSWPDTPTDNGGAKMGRGRGRVGQGQGMQHSQQHQHSRDSSRDQYTLQESIFSEASYLESSHTVDSGDAAPGPTVSRGTTRDGTPSKRGEEGEGSASTSRNSGDWKRWSLGGAAGALEEGKRTARQSPLAGKVLTASRSAEPLRRPSKETIASKDVDRTGGQSLQSKELNPNTPNPATRGTVEGGLSPRPGNDGASASRQKQGEHREKPGLISAQVPGSQDKGKEKETLRGQSSLEVLRKRKSQEKQQRTEDDSTNSIPGPRERRQRRRSVILSRKHRIAELRKTLEKPDTQPQDLLWERRLSSSSESSGATPRASPSYSPRRERPRSLSRAQRRRPTTLPAYLSFTPVRTVADLRPSSPAGSSGESNRSPSQRASALLNKKDSVSLSLSSPTTVATIVKTSPVPPFQSLGSVTPPQSPPASSVSPSTPSPSSELYPQHDEQGSSITSTPLRPQPPLKRLESVRRRASLEGRSSSVGASLGRRPSSPVAEGIRLGTTSPSRPKTAGKGGIVGARKKDYFSGTLSFGHDQPPSQQPGTQATISSSPVTSPATTSSSFVNRADLASGGADAVPTTSGAGKMKSALKLTRSELFERYEAVRDRQSRDLERRLRRLEKHGDYWLTSMLPLLSDLSQTLGQLALGGASDGQRHSQQQQQQGSSNSRKGKGRAIAADDMSDDDDDDDDEVRGAIYADGRKSRFGIRSTPAVHMAGLEPFFDQRPSTSTVDISEGIYFNRHGHNRSNTMGSRRVYLREGSDGSHHPGIGYRVRVEDHPDEREEGDHRDHHHHHHGASSITTTPNRYYRRNSAKSTPPRRHQQPASGSTTMVETTSINNTTNAAARANSLGSTIPGSFRTARHHDDEFDNSKNNKKRNRMTKAPYALHANAPLSSFSTSRLLSERVTAETERLARIERMNDHIDAQIRSLPSSRSRDTDESPDAWGGGSGGGGLLAPPRFPRLVKASDESLETYRGTTTDEDSEGEENSDEDDRQRRVRLGEKHHFDGDDDVFLERRGRGRGIGGRGLQRQSVTRERGTGMEDVTPLMRELQANGSRLSLESDGSCGEGDFEVRALRRGPEPRSVVGFGAFRDRYK